MKTYSSSPLGSPLLIICLIAGVLISPAYCSESSPYDFRSVRLANNDGNSTITLVPSVDFTTHAYVPDNFSSDIPRVISCDSNKSTDFIKLSCAELDCPNLSPLSTIEIGNITTYGLSFHFTNSTFFYVFGFLKFNFKATLINPDGSDLPGSPLIGNGEIPIDGNVTGFEPALLVNLTRQNLVCFVSTPHDTLIESIINQWAFNNSYNYIYDFVSAATDVTDFSAYKDATPHACLNGTLSDPKEETFYFTVKGLDLVYAILTVKKLSTKDICIWKMDKYSGLITHNWDMEYNLTIMGLRDNSLRDVTEGQVRVASGGLLKPCEADTGSNWITLKIDVTGEHNIREAIEEKVAQMIDGLYIQVTEKVKSIITGFGPVFSEEYDLDQDADTMEFI